ELASGGGRCEAANRGAGEEEIAFGNVASAASTDVVALPVTAAGASSALRSCAGDSGCAGEATATVGCCVPLIVSCVGAGEVVAVAATAFAAARVIGVGETVSADCRSVGTATAGAPAAGGGAPVPPGVIAAPLTAELDDPVLTVGAVVFVVWAATPPVTGAAAASSAGVTASLAGATAAVTGAVASLTTG